ncbi:MAG: precorrin-6 methyltransferase CbiE [Candidatus Scalindua rubra]|uniref:Precorrin-6 methyltransferase CbiE n=1 Tax=Candidatus Scalindua rubra TaxID=1872076 RepID=A0A1E3XGD8_9BACT|nr:MAG: precorrin-6 methyltransferase CbiE [Candidatus Scalindua rubra]
MAKKLINKITIVGCGPGSKKYITGHAVQHIKNADALIGSRRLLALFPDVEADKYTLNKNYKPLITRIVSLSKHRKVVVLVSGDPGFFSYAKLIIDKVGIENCEVVPGISSVQLAFAAIGKTWSDACFVSLHGQKDRLSTLIKKVKEHKKVAVLTDNSNNVKLIAKRLLDEGLKDRKIYICEDLSLNKERIRKFDVSSMQKFR